MTGKPLQVASATPGAHLLLYDGECGLCNRAVQFVLRHDHREVFSFAWLQGEVGRTWLHKMGAPRDGVGTVLVVPHYATTTAVPIGRSDCVLFIAAELGWPWKGAAALRIVPTPIRDRLYDFIARHRHRVFGRSDRCLVPQVQWRHRFLDGRLS